MNATQAQRPGETQASKAAREIGTQTTPWKHLKKIKNAQEIRELLDKNVKVEEMYDIMQKMWPEKAYNKTCIVREDPGQLIHRGNVAIVTDTD